MSEYNLRHCYCTLIKSPKHLQDAALNFIIFLFIVFFRYIDGTEGNGAINSFRLLPMLSKLRKLFRERKLLRYFTIGNAEHNSAVVRRKEVLLLV